jgi:hypothetical protein
MAADYGHRPCILSGADVLTLFAAEKYTVLISCVLFVSFATRSIFSFIASFEILKKSNREAGMELVD